LVTLVLCGMALSVALAARSLRRLNPVGRLWSFRTMRSHAFLPLWDL
jgi:hypothetical protein